MVKLVLFDLGNVFVRSYDMDALHKKLKSPVSAEEFKERCRKLVMQGDINRGKYDADEVAGLLLECAETEMPHEEVLRLYRLCRGSVNCEAIRALYHCRDKGIKTGVLSNVDIVLADDMRRFFEELPFDHVFYSCDLGTIKPEEEIYRTVEKLTGYSGNEILFFDDVEENIESAAKLGWNTVKTDSSVYEPVVEQLVRFRV